MTGGFALLAYPAEYGDSGVMTFMVNPRALFLRRTSAPGPHARAPSSSTIQMKAGALQQIDRKGQMSVERPKVG